MLPFEPSSVGVTLFFCDFLKTLSHPLALLKYRLHFSLTSLKLVNAFCCLVQVPIVKFRNPCVVTTK